MLHTALLIGGLLLGQSSGAAVAPTENAGANVAEADLAVTVRGLVRQLDAARLAERETAERQLLAMGPEVLDLLPSTDARQSAETKLRLGRIRQQLQHAAAASGAEASSITLSGTAMPLSEIIAALQEQSGNKIVDTRRQVTDPKLKVDFQAAPFWEAVDQILDQASMDIYPFAEEATLSLTTRPEGINISRAARGSYAGPFRIEPVRIEASRDLRRSDTESLRLTLEIAWEPRIKPILLKQPMATVKILDGQGGTLAVADPEMEVGVPTSGANTVEMVIPLKLPPRDVEKIASLQGTLMAMIPGRTETFTFENLLEQRDGKPVKKRIAGATVTLDRVRQNNAVWQVYMRVRFDEAGKALESHRGWIYDNEAYLEGPDGKPIEPDSFETTRQTANEIGIAYLFVLDDPPEKHKFVYKTPGIIVTTGFDYEIKDIRLP